jgi:hypothetical protein
MKKITLLMIFLIFITARLALTEGAFVIDAEHMYDKMARPYAQGYSPIIERDIAHVVLPLLSDAFEGDIEVEFISFYPDSSPVKLSNTFKQTAKLETFTFSGTKVNAYKIYFRLMLHPSRQNGEYPCQIAVQGADASGNVINQVFPITLRVNDGQANDEAPDVSIEAFEVVEPLRVGESGTLRLTIANRGSTREARGVRLTMADNSGDIMPESSDTLSIGILGAGESAVIDIPVRALAKASAQPHALQFTLSYEYAEGKVVSKSEKRTIDLVQEVRLNHTEAALPARVIQGDNAAFSLTLMNMGKGTLYNALLTFDVPHMAQGSSVLAGTIEPGTSVTANTNLRVDGEHTGEVEGTLTLNWEDGYGKGYEKTLPLSTTVVKKTVHNVPASASKASDGNDEEFKPRELVAWCLSVAFILILSVVMFRSGRKIRKLEERQL